MSNRQLSTEPGQFQDPQSAAFRVAVVLWIASMVELGIVRDWLMFTVAGGFVVFLSLALFATTRLAPLSAALPSRRSAIVK